MCLKCSRIFDDQFIGNFFEYNSERMLKVGQYLTELRQKVFIGVFMTHGIAESHLIYL